MGLYQRVYLPLCACGLFLLVGQIELIGAYPASPRVDFNAVRHNIVGSVLANRDTNAHDRVQQRGGSRPSQAAVLTVDKQGLDNDWWQSTTMYQIYPRSFKDSDGDGIGDLKGIISEIDHLANLGVETLWLSPVYKSPMADFGYDISDFRDVDPIFGTIDDLRELVDALHARGMRILMDFVPNHSSNEHEWFQKSVQRIDPYTDYYVWQDPKGLDDEGKPIAPSNWVSVFKFSAWAWNEERQQFYLHQFAPQQPDLNYYNELVMQEMLDVVTFWLDFGVDGFRCDAVAQIGEVNDYTMDEPLSNNPGVTDPDDYGYLQHVYTANHPQTFEVLRNFRKLMDDYSAANGLETKFMITEIYENITTSLMYYGTEEEPIAHLPFNFRFIFDGELNGNIIRDIVRPWLDALPEWNPHTNWVTGNHDNKHRVSNRFGPQNIDIMMMLVHLLPGTSVTYYGEEIGMEDTFISWEDTVDPWGCNFGPDHYQESSRDPVRTPMQWNDQNNAGFTTGGTTWLPVNENYPLINVAAQETEPSSHLNIDRTLMTLRKSETNRRGAIVFPDELNDSPDSLVFFRMLEPVAENPSYAVLVNFSDQDRNYDLTSISFFPPEAVVITRSGSATNPATLPGSTVDTSAVTLGPSEGLVLEFNAI